MCGYPPLVRRWFSIIFNIWFASTEMNRWASTQFSIWWKFALKPSVDFIHLNAYSSITPLSYLPESTILSNFHGISLKIGIGQIEKEHLPVKINIPLTHPSVNKTCLRLDILFACRQLCIEAYFADTLVLLLYLCNIIIYINCIIEFQYGFCYYLINFLDFGKLLFCYYCIITIPYNI